MLGAVFEHMVSPHDTLEEGIKPGGWPEMQQRAQCEPFLNPFI